ncbi:MAG: TRAP transporter small permease [Pseudomonadota bacterium]
MQIAPRLEAWAGHGAEALARGLAYFGGAVLVGLALMTLISILGRWINTGPIRAITGDYELVEAGVAIAVFAFLPWCQLRRGHVTVDIFTNALPGRGRSLTAWLGDVLITLAAFVVMWRFYLGFGEKFPFFSEAWRDRLAMGFKPFFPETTYELEVQIWIPYGLALLGAVAFFLVSLYTVWRGWNRLAAGRAVEQEA